MFAISHTSKVNIDMFPTMPQQVTCFNGLFFIPVQIHLYK